MANMSYCRFENTAADLRDCLDNIDDILGKDEARARLQIFKMCEEIVRDFSIHDLKEWSKPEK